MLKPYKYKFTTMHPPLMRDIKGPPTEIPSTDLEQQVGGIASWKKDEEVTSLVGAGGLVVTYTQTSVFTVTRKRVWVCTDVPHHFSKDSRIKVTYVTGYTRTEKKAFADTVEGSMEGKLWGFGINIKNILQLTEETEQQWHEETTTETETTFLAEHWYVSWNLLDILTATRQVSGFFRPVVISADFKVVLSIYDDVVSDKDIQIAPSTDRTTLKIRPLGI